ncbi:hypothetical protein [Nocardioides sp.]|uniref:hypothetical protein n=1 Tax=Nocardioides sp. TaxID=35761 RepID=UPI0035B2A1FC
MARGTVRCTSCSQPLTPHCPDTNPTCTWLACLAQGCSVRYLDVGRGLIQHTDGSIISWADMPTTTEPPTVTIEDDTDDGRAAAPDA